MEAVEDTFAVEVAAEAVEAGRSRMAVSSGYGAQTTNFSSDVPIRAAESRFQPPSSPSRPRTAASRICPHA